MIVFFFKKSIKATPWFILAVPLFPRAVQGQELLEPVTELSFALSPQGSAPMP